LPLCGDPTLFSARLGLRPAQGDQIAPKIAATVDVDRAGQGHDQSSKRGHLCDGPLLLDWFGLLLAYPVDTDTYQGLCLHGKGLSPLDALHR
jgi:hypothetical protein